MAEIPQAIVSVIIPCYNHGIYLQQAIDSVLAADVAGITEIIIVDDGSTDAETINKLEALSANESIKVLKKSNGGVASARNAGIAISQTKYILPLDADNKLKMPYLSAGVDIMENNSGVAVVYGDAEYFGEKKGIWKNQAFSLQRLMLTNFIDTCALIRKESLVSAGNYRSAFGYEDWDLWLRIAEQGKKFFYLDEVCFEYQVLENSMINTLFADKGRSNEALENIYLLHKGFIDPAAFEEYLITTFKKAPLGIIGKIIMKAYFPAWYLKLYKRKKVRKYF